MLDILIPIQMISNNGICMICLVAMQLEINIFPLKNKHTQKIINSWKNPLNKTPLFLDVFPCKYIADNAWLNDFYGVISRDTRNISHTWTVILIFLFHCNIEREAAHKKHIYVYFFCVRYLYVKKYVEILNVFSFNCILIRLKG